MGNEYVRLFPPDLHPRLDALAYAWEHQDGEGMHVEGADIVLVGVSRSTKTPTALYIAAVHGLRVACVPIVLGGDHQSISAVDPAKVVQLIIDKDLLLARRLHRIEEELAAGPNHAVLLARMHMLESYVDPACIADELRFARRLGGRFGWQTVQVARRGIEETASRVLSACGLSGRRLE